MYFIDGVPISEVFDTGKKYFIRTVTYHLVGELDCVLDGFLLFKNCSWVANSGRFSDAIKKGTLDEVEYIGNWFCAISSIVDGGEWKHDLPTETK